MKFLVLPKYSLTNSTSRIPDAEPRGGARHIERDRCESTKPSPNSAKPSNSTRITRSPTTASGPALATKGLLDEAIAEFRKAIELDPNNAMAKVNLEKALGLQESRNREH